MKDFKLHPNLASKYLLFDLPLCHVFLENSNHFPWLIMVPRYANASRIMDLPPKEQLLLLSELDQMQKLLWNEFHPTQINVAAIGNKTPQLHIHVIARFENDPAWPNTVWDYPNEATAPLPDYVTRLKRAVGKVRSLLS